jgi:hypothetical protein
LRVKIKHLFGINYLHFKIEDFIFSDAIGSALAISELRWRNTAQLTPDGQTVQGFSPTFDEPIEG